METCENCGRSIGNLETPHLIDEHIVCAECHDKIKAERSRSEADQIIELGDPLSQEELDPIDLLASEAPGPKQWSNAPWRDRARKEEQEKREKAEATMKCPQCGSPHLTYNKKGFGLGKAAVGGLIAGPVGLLGGVIGSGKIRITCLKCGHAFMAGEQ